MEASHYLEVAMGRISDLADVIDKTRKQHCIVTIVTTTSNNVHNEIKCAKLSNNNITADMNLSRNEKVLHKNELNPSNNNRLVQLLTVAKYAEQDVETETNGQETGCYDLAVQQR